MWIKNLMFAFILSLGFGSLTAVANPHLQDSNTGLIDTLNIEKRQLEINKKTYGLANNLKIYTFENAVGNEMLLRNGQKIEFWTQEQSSELLNKIPNLPTQVIVKIHLLTKDDSPLK